MKPDSKKTAGDINNTYIKWLIKPKKLKVVWI